MPKPFCFVIMPYGRKPTQVESGRGPGEIDFNALWDRAYLPAIEALGYKAVRADQDTGSMIITQMLERIFYADLVLADMTIPNGNVYYEVGIRHAAKETGCVLLAADWSQPLFDVAQMRTIRYPLPNGDVDAASAQAIQEAIKPGILSLSTGESPMFKAVSGFPGNPDPALATTMKESMRDLAKFQAAVREVRLLAKNQRMAAALKLVEVHGVPPLVGSTVSALLLLLRDSIDRDDDWTQLLRFIDHLPEEYGEMPEVQTQRAFAVSQTGDVRAAIGQLETLLDICGPSADRFGMLGGRYKRLFRDTAGTPEAARHLDSAIDYYERGMSFDLNGYYCSSNLPRLYRQRNRRGDLRRAESAAAVASAACERAVQRGVTEEWLRPTWLALAFDEGNADLAEDLVHKVAQDDVARWKIQSVLADLRESARLTADEDKRTRLGAVAEQLAAQSGIENSPA